MYYEFLATFIFIIGSYLILNKNRVNKLVISYSFTVLASILLFMNEQEYLAITLFICDFLIKNLLYVVIKENLIEEVKKRYSKYKKRYLVLLSIITLFILKLYWESSNIFVNKKEILINEDHILSIFLLLFVVINFRKRGVK